MSILIKAVSGLVAGVVAGGLGLAFVPRVEPNALQPRHAVEKPQFVVAAASHEATRAAPGVAVAAAPKPAAPVVTPEPAASAPPVVTAKLDSPQLKPPKADPPKNETTVAVVSPPPSPSSSPAPASEAAARWSVQGLVALANGDLASARQFLNRAAEAGDARAWVALADTYDPAMLSRLGVVGAPGDAQRAREYLVKAAAAGIVVAKDRVAAADQASGSVR